MVKKREKNPPGEKKPDGDIRTPSTSKKPVRKKKKKVPGDKIPRGRTGYRDFVRGLSVYVKENNVRITGKGRGVFLKKSGEIWKELKGKPGVLDNLDVILPNYLPPAPLEKYKKKKGQRFSPGEISDFIEREGYTEFAWYQSVTEFEDLMSTMYWTEDCILRVMDHLNNYKDIRSFDVYYRSVYSAMKHDYKSGKFSSPPPYFTFENVTSEKGSTYIMYQVNGWDFVEYDDTMREVEKVSRELEEKKRERAEKMAPGKKPPVTPPVPPAAEEKEIALARIESGRKQKAFEFEMEQLRSEFKEGVWNREEYKQEKEFIRKRYGL